MQVGMIGLGSDVRGHGPKAAPRRTPVRGVRPGRRSGSSSREGAVGAGSLNELVEKLTPAPGGLGHGACRRPHRADGPGLGRAECVRATPSSTAETLYFKDDLRRGAALKPKGLHDVDVGTSGGVWGLERGYCLMIGGPEEEVRRLDPIFHALAPGRGDIPPAHPAAKAATDGRGGLSALRSLRRRPFRQDDPQRHRVRNDAILCRRLRHPPRRQRRRSAQARRYQINLADVAEVWRRGSVGGCGCRTSRPTCWRRTPPLSNFSGVVQDSGEGRWTVEAAVEEAVPAAVLTSRSTPASVPAKNTTLGRRCSRRCGNKFGGHYGAPPRADSRAAQNGRGTSYGGSCGSGRRAAAAGRRRPPARRTGNAGALPGRAPMGHGPRGLLARRQVLEVFPHDHARSRAYRWGEDGLLGITDRECRLCFALALWNGRDPILKERLFGLTSPEGNHGEDVKECYFYLDSTPTLPT